MTTRKIYEHIESNYPNITFQVEIYVDFYSYDNDLVTENINFDISIVNNPNNNISEQDILINSADINTILYDKNIVISRNDIELIVQKLFDWEVEHYIDSSENLNYITITTPHFKNQLDYKKYIAQFLEIYKEILEDKDVNAVLEA